MTVVQLAQADEIGWALRDVQDVLQQEVTTFLTILKFQSELDLPQSRRYA